MKVPYAKQEILPTDVSAVVDVLQSDFLTQGPVVPLFEQSIASYCSSLRAVAVTSATAALHIALLALDVKPGDLVWTSPITFVASANAALFCGAKIDFVDIDPQTYNMCVNALEKKLCEAKNQGTLPKVVIPVHLAGQSCDMKRINGLSKRFGFKVIEDASHAIGGKYCGLTIGNCKYSDITVFSFHPVKIITTAEGGMALTNDHTIADKMELYRSHGVTRDPKLMTDEAHGPWYYQQIHLGYNYRMSDVQAALGLSQVQRLDQYVARRHGIAKRYNEELADLPISLPFQAPASFSAYHLYVIRLNLKAIPCMSHRGIFEKLRALGIMVNLHYIPVHTQPYYRNLGFSWGDFPNSEEYYQSAISLPMYPSLTDPEQTFVIEQTRNVLLE